MDYFYTTMSVLMEFPSLALIPALFLFPLSGFLKSKMLGICTATWVGYCLYESGMKYRILCSGECNIRVDLLLIYPALVVFTLIAIFSLFKKRKEPFYSGQEEDKDAL